MATAPTLLTIAVLLSGLHPLMSQEASAADAALLTPHPSIRITSDDGFMSPWSGVRSGSGTFDDPYVISDWLVARTSSYGIRIENTTAHVVIRNVEIVDGTTGRAAGSVECRVDPGPCYTAGVVVVNASNVRLQHVRTSNERWGLLLDGTSDIHVANLVVRGAPLHDSDVGLLLWRTGVETRASRNVTLDALDVSHVEWGFRFIASERVIVSRSIFGAQTYPLNVMGGGSSDVTIRDSLLLDGELIVSDGSANVTIERNAFDGPRAGVHVRGAEKGVSGLLLCGNRFEGYAGVLAAAVLTGVTDGIARANTFEGNVRALAFQGGARLDATGNVFANTTYYALTARMTHVEAHLNDFGAERRGVLSVLGATVDATSNWWGALDGPSGEGLGSGAAVQGAVAFDPWLQAPPPRHSDCGAS